MKILVAAIWALTIRVNAQVGPSGIVSPDGVNTQFTPEFANGIVLVGPSGIVTKSGSNRQLNPGEATLNAAIPPALAPIPVAKYLSSPRGVIGPSGIVRPNGNNIQFTYDQANNILLVGPSGIVTKDGNNIQFTDDLQLVHRVRRNLGLVSAKGNIGTSGILRADGSTDLFSLDLAHDILLIGPSGIVTKSGRNLQLTDDLRIVNPRSRRSLEGALIGSSGIITKSGQQIQFEPGVSVVQAGPSGVVLSNGRNIQFTQ
ncbi:uncharacterized protein [Macrobrachium rosenbergii]|uniref:uncharacterized protein n=1 Tax=Macrobrachium rosenbergii TaxID=79674 RepID=UPI0034D4264D